MNCTATDPSPTPEATRLIEPWRTSPTAKMPGTLVSLNYIRQPIGSRQRSNKNEHRACSHSFYLICVRAEHRNLFQVRSAMRLGHAGVRPKLNVGHLLNLIN